MSETAVAIHQPPAVPVLEPARPVNLAAGLLSVIERAVFDPSMDLDRLDRLFAKAKEIRDEQRREDFTEALAECQKEIPKVIKNRTNTHTKSLYATLDAVNDAAMPVITKHGFSVSFSTEPSAEKGFVTIICEVSRNGYIRTYRDEWPLDGAGSQGTANKTPIQARASSVTYGKRYLLCNIFNISVGEDRDGNRDRNEERAPDRPRITAEQVATLRAKLEAVKADEAGFLQYYRIEYLEDLAADLYEHATKALEKKARANG